MAGYEIIRRCFERNRQNESETCRVGGGAVRDAFLTELVGSFGGIERAVWEGTTKYTKHTKVFGCPEVVVL